MEDERDEVPQVTITTVATVSSSTTTLPSTTVSPATALTLYRQPPRYDRYQGSFQSTAFARIMLQLEADMMNTVWMLAAMQQSQPRQILLPPVVVATETHKDPCSICMSNIVKEETIHILPCAHSFHTVCLRPWFVDYSKKTCPLCRAAYVT